VCYGGRAQLLQCVVVGPGVMENFGWQALLWVRGGAKVDLQGCDLCNST
jgi:hypothetical protein